MGIPRTRHTPLFSFPLFAADRIFSLIRHSFLSSIPTSKTKRTIAVPTIEHLTRITTRGILPSLPPLTNIALELLPATATQRPVWERRVARWAGACGCSLSTVVFVSVATTFFALHALAHLDISLGRIPKPVLWVLIGLAAATITKLGVVLYARSALMKLHRTIATAAFRKVDIQ
jgi:hypothetical protein